jgi:alkylhydroperoxidase family enzyme
MARIAPVEPPYSDEVAAHLRQMMPAGLPPIALFRTFVRNPGMTEAMRPWGSYELSKGVSLSLRDREVVIDRTCARCGCEYEWGIHITVYAERAGLDDAQVRSLTHGGPADECWADERDRLLIEAADQLHDTSDLADDLWGRLAAVFDDRELLDLLLLAGWYHAISYVGRAARVDHEPGTPRFADVR